MEGVYRTPFEKFERYIPYGTPAQVAEFIAPFIEAGATTSSRLPAAMKPLSTPWPKHAKCLEGSVLPPRSDFCGADVAFGMCDSPGPFG